MKKRQGHLGYRPQKLMLTQQKNKILPTTVESTDAGGDHRQILDQQQQLMISTVDESKTSSSIVDLGKSTLPYQVKV